MNAGRMKAAGGATAFEEIRRKVESGGRIDREEALALLHHHDLPALGAMADAVRYRHWPEPIVTYVIGRNLNYTNVCWVKCRFCAFYRPPGSNEGYTLTRDEIAAKIQELVDLGGREVLFQGGLNPALKLDYYLETFRWIKGTWDVHIHGLSPTEIIYIAHISSLPLDRCLGMLRDAGLDTVPGAGGEILVDRVRKILAPGKDMADEWIDFMRTAHRLGIRTSSTMMYGSVETLEERVEHLDRLRRSPGRDRRLQLLHPMVVPAGADRDEGDPEGLGVRLPAHAGRGADLSRQHPLLPGLVGDAGAEDRPGRACASA